PGAGVVPAPSGFTGIGASAATGAATTALACAGDPHPEAPSARTDATHAPESAARKTRPRITGSPIERNSATVGYRRCTSEAWVWITSREPRDAGASTTAPSFFLGVTSAPPRVACA